MKVVVAPDKFKDCLKADEVARAIATGLRHADPNAEIDECPMADGGEGTVQALVAATGGRIVTRRVTGPLPRMKVDAPIGLLGDGVTAVVEMASASGLHLLRPEQRDPTRTTTYGTGELLREAAELGARRIILGIGGSATVDGGVGCAQAWGASFTLSTGTIYRPNGRRLTGGDLIHLRSVESPLPLETHGIEFIVACDVGNPLLGPDGAAPIFGPQKGATPEQVEQLELGLERLVEKTGLWELASRPGAGAAGGLGFGMMAFFGAQLRPGVQIVIEAVKLPQRLHEADLCITGEGRLDSQSLAGKTVIGVARLCKQRGVPCVALAGSVGEGVQPATDQGLDAWFTITQGPMTVEQAISQAPQLLARTAESVLRLFQRSRRSVEKAGQAPGDLPHGA
ncbi:glycerate kinase family protein [Fontivita pretiosa]|uniref:glycerate kinase family protein n=1 Tax=Fontivita pretiosa TaxID=2989684 RepID=UPI003D169CF1